MIKFTYVKDNKPKEYRLAFDRASVKYAEKKKGFTFTDFGDLPLTSYSTLFNVAFLKYHGILSEDLTDEIFKTFKDKEGLIKVLIGEYSDVLTAFISDSEDETEEAETKKIMWEIA